MKLDPEKKIDASYKIYDEKRGRFVGPEEMPKVTRPRKTAIAADSLDILLAAGLGYLIKKMIRSLR